MDEGNGSRTLTSVIKVLDIIEELWECDGAGVTELKDRTGFPKSTIHAHLSSLRQKGYVVKDGQKYRLSLRFLTYGEYVKRSEPLYAASQDPIDDMADRTGERVFCVTNQNGLATVLYVSDGERSLDTDINIGTHMYLHASAAGRAMLAYFPEERVDAVIDKWGLPEFTDDTITTREALFEEMEAIRERGVAITKGEYRPGVYAVSAPILDQEDTVHGAVALTGPEQRLRSEWTDDELYNHLLSAANTIEVNLMFSWE